jgi:hypothetical protein
MLESIKNLSTVRQGREKRFEPESRVKKMLDIDKRTPQQQKTVENVIKSPQVLTELLESLRSKKCSVRYSNFKAVYLISEDHPEILYPRWAFFEDSLKSKNNTFMFYAIHVLANLAKIDEAERFEKIFDHFYNILEGDALIPACHVAYVSHKIAKAKPKLADNITEKLLTVEGTRYKHRELVQANALRSFSEYFDLVKDREKVLELARELQKNKSQRAKKEATEFLKQHSI